MLVFCSHKSESLCIAHIAMVTTANQHIEMNYMYDDNHGWRTYWKDNSLTMELCDEES